MRDIAFPALGYAVLALIVDKLQECKPLEKICALHFVTDQGSDGIVEKTVAACFVSAGRDDIPKMIKANYSKSQDDAILHCERRCVIVNRLKCRKGKEASEHYDAFLNKYLKYSCEHIRPVRYPLVWLPVIIDQEECDDGEYYVVNAENISAKEAEKLIPILNKLYRNALTDSRNDFSVLFEQVKHSISEAENSRNSLGERGTYDEIMADMLKACCEFVFADSPSGNDSVIEVVEDTIIQDEFMEAHISKLDQVIAELRNRVSRNNITKDRPDSTDATDYAFLYKQKNGTELVCIDEKYFCELVEQIGISDYSFGDFSGECKEDEILVTDSGRNNLNVSLGITILWNKTCTRNCREIKRANVCNTDYFSCDPYYFYVRKSM